jgi:uncharacterized repeat protein (TIGR03803 family)
MTKRQILLLAFAAGPATNEKIARAKLVCFMLAFCIAASIPTSAQTFAKLANLAASDGNSPIAPLVQGLDGNFYGTAYSGGTNDMGTVFKMTPEGTVAVLHSFAFRDGGNPSSLLLATDGDFYGVTFIGGTSGGCDTNGCGTIFRITPPGVLTTVYGFCAQANCADGSFPASLLQGADGNFYGTTGGGGANTNPINCSPYGCGTFFEITRAGTLVTLYSFCSQANCADGTNPHGIVQAPNGNFYGIAATGGANTSCNAGSGCGTVFEITPEGKLTTLYNFCAQVGCADGFSAFGALIQGVDGNFYGTTYGGGIHGKGTVFRLTRSGTLTTLHSFNSSDGEFPIAGLTQGSDGNLYGTTQFGGSGSVRCYPYGCGSVFEITAEGTLTTLRRLLPADGAWPSAELAQGTNGDFYGTTSGRGADGYGTVFGVSTGVSPFIKTLPTIGRAGAKVRILGNNLTGAISVTFSGTPTTFAVVSDTQITATVPTGTTTGRVEVTTPSATLKSNVAFHVVQ